MPEARRLVRAVGESDERRAFRLGWSRWGRAHQMIAARCYAAYHARRRSHATNDDPILPPALARGALTDAEWERVWPVLPPQQPKTGRRRHDHRIVLNGILAVVGTHLSWREIPKEYGKWERAYKRYRLWCDEGRWPRIVAALGVRDTK